MTADELRALQEARPFQPFDMWLNGGRVVRVARPDVITFLHERKLFRVEAVLDGFGGIVDPRNVSRIELAENFNNDDAAMTIEQIRKLAHTTPFVPFEIELVGGRLIHVKHPDFLAMDPGGLTITVYELPHAGEFIDVKLILSLKVHRIPQD